MPDDCGDIEIRFLAKLVNKARQKQCNSVYKRYNNICDYCGGVAQKYNCVNCGAPQEPAKATVVTPTEQGSNFFISEPGEVLRFRNVGVDSSYWT